MMKISLLTALLGFLMLNYGLYTLPAELSFVELLQLEAILQQAYYNNVNKATFIQLTGCVLIGIGLVSFVIMRSVKIHKKP